MKGTPFGITNNTTCFLWMEAAAFVTQIMH